MNGRRLGARAEEPQPGWWTHPALPRLLLVLVTILGVTALAYLAGPPLPFRVGQVHTRDLRVREYFELVNQEKTEQARDDAVHRLSAELRDDPLAREEARRGVDPVIEQYPAGKILVPRGVPISERQYALLLEEHRAYQASLGPRDLLRRAVSLFLIMALLATLIVFYVARFETELAVSTRKITVLGATVLLTVGLCLLLSNTPMEGSLIPLTVTAMVLTIAYNPMFALVVSFSMALATRVALGVDQSQLLIQVAGVATAVLLLRNLRTRTRLVEVSAAAGLAYLAMTVAAGLLNDESWSIISFDAVRNFACGTLAGFLLAGSLPLVERCFGVITDISLTELADGSHPLLKELLRRAPGTYTHSMMVAHLAEAASEAIGANPLLARVGSSFHDIGKMLKPQYFIENQTGENRHDSLEPGLSTLIIINHVKDGVALAKQHNLPQPLVDFIEQHHGTTLVEYFYHEAVRQRELAGHGDGELESSFRYPGPKPQYREIGVVMLADAVESTSRALSDPNPNSLRKLVHDLLMKRLLDGQFEESGLTLSELHLIEESLYKSLVALFHARIKYPEREPEKPREKERSAKATAVAPSSGQ
ncbi:MAG: HD family phosphohydrolase [Gemmataceae bacterium]